MSYDTREEWLNALAQVLWNDFDAIMHPLPEKLRISTGWPSQRALSERSRVLAQTWYPSTSRDGTTEIFISPSIDDPVDVGAALAHELCHAALDAAAGHGPRFKTVARALGLTGKMTATKPTPEFRKHLAAIAAQLGPFPHAAIDISQRKRQTTRMILVKCAQCGYQVRTTRAWLAIATPTCPDQNCAAFGAMMQPASR